MKMTVLEAIELYERDFNNGDLSFQLPDIDVIIEYAEQREAENLRNLLKEKESGKTYENHSRNK